MSIRNTYFLFLFCLTGFLSTRAQTIENVTSAYDGEKMVITYDLNATDATQKFKVSLFSSHNNYTQPLTLLTGDFGDNILPGKNHRVTWDVKNAVPADFDGEISIKVKAARIIPVSEPVISKLAVKPLAQNKYKKGSKVELSWSGGQVGDKIIIEVLKGGQVVQKLSEKPNSAQSYSWQMPTDMKPGKDYTGRLTNSSRAGDVASSQVFAINPKIPLWVKGAGVVVFGAVVYVVASGYKSEDSTTTLSDLPGPVKPN